MGQSARKMTNNKKQQTSSIQDPYMVSNQPVGVEFLSLFPEMEGKVLPFPSEILPMYFVLVSDLGFAQALILHKIHTWLREKVTRRCKLAEEKIWIYHPTNKWVDIFPELTPRAFIRAVNELKQKNCWSANNCRACKGG